MTDLQSYNRYSYVGNNPLRYTDPTGYVFSEIGTFFKNYFSDPMNVYFFVASVAICAVSYGVGCAAWGLEVALLQVTVGVEKGAGFKETILAAGIGLGVGIATAGVLSYAEVSPLVAILVGAASAAVTTGISNVIAGRDFFDYNVLGAALLSAAQGAATIGLQKLALVSQASLREAQGGDAPGELRGGAPNCDKNCQAAIKNAFDGNPRAKSLEGTIYFELTGETGGNEYGGTVRGLPEARFRAWAAERLQRIFDEYGVKYDVSKTRLYIGGGTSHSVGFGAIQLETPGLDPGGSFLRTGRSILHELGHQAQMAQAGGFSQMMTTWRAQRDAAGGNLSLVHDTPGTFEWRADQFANTYLPRLIR